ncbi:hypothetical protein NVP2275O_429 [Vibrio phage 2.275.O._10N.286.54.E11]|nr:hypothetical protein NVP2275O_429 [Vibrio phage 2.275.O._10N.286.54.E11]
MTRTNIMAVDRRVRLRPRDGAEGYVYGDDASEGPVRPGLLSILRTTNGMIWPTTPTINVSQAANYESTQPTHSVAAYNTFENTANTTITVAGEFHVGNASEAYYLLASIHFLRTLTKMDFGRSSSTRGTPPPVMLFSAYGSYMFNDIPVVVKNTNFEFRNDVDYIQVPIQATDSFGFYGTEGTKDTFFDSFIKKDDKVWVPQVMNINVSLEQQPTASYVTNDFNLNEFKKGKLLLKGGFI